jgi:hypothetical protein
MNSEFLNFGHYAITKSTLSTPSSRVTLFFMDSALSLTKYWLENIVIGLDLCPFARIPFEKGLIRLSVCEDTDEVQQLSYFLNELVLLNENPSDIISTSVLVYPYGHTDFLAFNDFVGDLESMLDEAGLENVFQLVAFHPKFVFENTEAFELGNLVNRSPFPIIHILRSEEVQRALKNPKEGEAISFNNEKKLNGLSKDTIADIFYYLKDYKLPYNNGDKKSKRKET